MKTKGNQKKKVKAKSKLLVFILLGVGILGGILAYLHSLRYETTDDAQMDTDITSVSSRITGFIAEVYFEDNAVVQAGDTLLILDDRELVLKEAQAETALENALALLGSTRENTHSVEQAGGTGSLRTEELRIRLENSKKDLERYKKMCSSGSATQQQLDKIRTEKETLEKQLEASLLSEKELHSKIGAATQQISVSETLVKQRRLELEYAQLNHSYAYITAPFNGVVSKKNAVKGQLIQTGQPLCAIIATDNVWVTANFKETQLRNIREGMKVNVKIDAFPDKELEGKIASFSSATGSKFSLIPPDNASGNYVKVVQRVPVHIDLDKTNPIYPRIKPGMNVSVKVIL